MGLNVVPTVVVVVVGRVLVVVVVVDMLVVLVAVGGGTCLMVSVLTKEDGEILIKASLPSALGSMLILKELIGDGGSWRSSWSIVSVESSSRFGRSGAGADRWVESLLAVVDAGLRRVGRRTSTTFIK